MLLLIWDGPSELTALYTYSEKHWVFALMSKSTICMGKNRVVWLGLISQDIAHLAWQAYQHHTLETVVFLPWILALWIYPYKINELLGLGGVFIFGLGSHALVPPTNNITFNFFINEERYSKLNSENRSACSGCSKN